MTQNYASKDFDHIFSFVTSQKQCFDSYWCIDILFKKSAYNILMIMDTEKLEIDYINICPLICIDGYIERGIPVNKIILKEIVNHILDYIV